MRPGALGRDRLELPARRRLRPSSGERCLALTGGLGRRAGVGSRRCGGRGRRSRPPRSSLADDPDEGTRRSRATPATRGRAATSASSRSTVPRRRSRRAEGYAWVVDGTNASDTERTDRPGMTAGAELGRPLAARRSRHHQGPAAQPGPSAGHRRLGSAGVGLPGEPDPVRRADHGRSAAAGRVGRAGSSGARLRSGPRPGLRQPRPGRGRGGRPARAADQPAADVQARLVGLGFESWSPAAYAGNRRRRRPECLG